MPAQLGINGATLLIYDHGIGLSSDQWHRDAISASGHSLPNQKGPNTGLYPLLA
jgi:hypothetical protein